MFYVDTVNMFVNNGYATTIEVSCTLGCGARGVGTSSFLTGSRRDAAYAIASSAAVIDAALEVVSEKEAAGGGRYLTVSRDGDRVVTYRVKGELTPAEERELENALRAFMPAVCMEFRQ
jgi:hypothetical protein